MLYLFVVCRKLPQRAEEGHVKPPGKHWNVPRIWQQESIEVRINTLFLQKYSNYMNLSCD